MRRVVIEEALEFLPETWPVKYCTLIQYFAMIEAMDSLPSSIWIAACAHTLQQQWRTVDPNQLEELAGDLWRDERLRAMAPGEAARVWLEPVAGDSRQ